MCAPGDGGGGAQGAGPARTCRSLQKRFLCAVLICLNEKVFIHGSRLSDWVELLLFKGEKRWLGSLRISFSKLLRRPAAGFVSPSGWLPFFPAPRRRPSLFNKAEVVYSLGMKSRMGRHTPGGPWGPLSLCAWVGSHSAPPTPLVPGRSVARDEAMGPTKMPHSSLPTSGSQPRAPGSCAEFLMGVTKGCPQAPLGWGPGQEAHPTLAHLSTVGA